VFELSAGQITVLALAAVAVFWMLGAYNRVMALRNAIGTAWQQIDQTLQRRAVAVTPLVAALRRPLAAEQGALDALLAAQAQVQTAADAVRQRPVQDARVAALAGAEAAMAAAASRVLALLDQHTGLMADAAVAPHVGAVREAGQRLAFARQLFNEASQRYDAAVQQFPTRLLARLYGFGAAGRL